MPLKRLEDYTNDELLSLSDEDINTLIDLECAHAGIPLLPPLPEPVKKVEVEPDIELFEVGVESNYFETRDDAAEVADLITKKKRIRVGYASGPSYKKKVSGVDTGSVDIKTIRVFSRDLWSSVGAETERIEVLHKEYEEAKSHYDEVVKSRKEISDRIYDSVNEANNERRLLDALCSEARRYLKLALGDKEIAMRFMIDARKNQEEKIRAHFDGWVVENVRAQMEGA